MKNDGMAREEYIGIRTSTEIKNILQEIARKDYRTLSQQCEMILIQWLKDHGHMPESPEKKPPKK
jgi:hypothetical protein